MEDILIDAAPDDFRRDRVPWVFIVILCPPIEVFALADYWRFFLPRLYRYSFHTVRQEVSDSVSHTPRHVSALTRN